MVIHQGEQFKIPFAVTVGDETATPENVDGVRIKIANIVKEYPGDIEFNETSQTWDFPITEQETLDFMSGTKPCQIGVKVGDDILKTDVFGINVRNSILKEVWSDGV